MLFQEATAYINSFLKTEKLPPVIIPAGGKSSRMGYPKGLLEFKNQHWLTYQLKKFRLAGGTRAVVVLGYDAEKYISELPWITGKEGDYNIGSLKVTVCINPDPENGPFSSIQTAAKILLAEGAEKSFMCAVDVPFPSSETWHSINNAGRYDMTVPVCNNVKANPVLLSGSFLQKIIKASPESRLVDEKEKLDRVKTIALDDALLGINANTPEKWEKVKKLIEHKNMPVRVALSAGLHEGKTTSLLKLAKELEKKGFSVGGIVQPAIFEDGKRTGYMLLNIATKEQIKFATAKDTPDENGLGYDFLNEGWQWAESCIEYGRKNCDILIVDELGKLEAKGRGHMETLKKECEDESNIMQIFTVRKSCEQQLDSLLSFDFI